jgi:Flp pilus assembly protein TadD
MEAAIMTTTVCFFDSLLAQARRLQQAGQSSQAIQALTRLAALADLPADTAAEVHARLGELHLKRHRFRKARRHLRRALGLAPDSARLHHRLGLCHGNDPRGQAERARRHYRRAIDLDPDRPRWRGEAGLLAIRLGRMDEGLSLLRQAHEQVPDDVNVLGQLVKGLCQTGQPDEALRLVRLARFRSPRCRRLQKLQADLLLARLRRSQETESACQRPDPVILPFLRAEVEATGEARYDGPHALPGPHLVYVRASAGCRVP